MSEHTYRLCDSCGVKLGEYEAAAAKLYIRPFGKEAQCFTLPDGKSSKERVLCTVAIDIHQVVDMSNRIYEMGPHMCRTCRDAMARATLEAAAKMLDQAMLQDAQEHAESVERWFKDTGRK